MGLDVYSYAGLVCTVEELFRALLPRLSPVSLQKFKQDVAEVLQTTVQQGDDGLEYSFGSKNRLISSFQKIQNSAQLVEWFLQVFRNCVEESDSPSRLSHEEALICLWQCLTEAPEFSGLPNQVGFFHSGKSRMNGGDLESNKVIALFDQRGLFELSAMGRGLANLLGQSTLSLRSFASLSDWTEATAVATRQIWRSRIVQPGLPHRKVGRRTPARWPPVDTTARPRGGGVIS
jgi:hypothetical protein